MITRQPDGLLTLLNEYLIEHLISFWITISGQIAGQQQYVGATTLLFHSL